MRNEYLRIKDDIIRFRLTKEERKELVKEANQKGITLSSLVRNLISKGR